MTDCDHYKMPYGNRLYCGFCAQLWELDGSPVDMKTVKWNCIQSAPVSEVGAG